MVHKMQSRPIRTGFLPKFSMKMAKVNPIQLQKHLKGVDYPASKEQLIQHAQKQGADDNAISALQQIPDQEYETPTDVSAAVGDIE
ncbi:hypothetical protein SAMD00079811_39810 [Scytonema sp. HK-05]|nr:hypothetical protein SAMD00079811_39810 [Scytonema sp. HK-05]